MVPQFRNFSYVMVGILLYGLVEHTHHKKLPSWESSGRMSLLLNLRSKVLTHKFEFPTTEFNRTKNLAVREIHCFNTKIVGINIKYNNATTKNVIQELPFLKKCKLEKILTSGDLKACRCSN